ncbi:MAG: N-acetyl sugar amidotransferase [Patescibacteria group bacterium]|nr:N-acetyl sugar amidotransferase [Patescibacteria group bacterium]
MILLDEQGICSGCRFMEQRPKVDYAKREEILQKMVEEYKAKAKANGSPYDCIIPVSGGKDSHYQTYFIKKVCGMNPLLVTYNHALNTATGIRNLNNLVEKLGCDLVRFTSNPESVRRISRYMLKKVGDVTWHYHAGIKTFPIQIAVKYRIPLIVWGELGFADMMGMYRHEDMLEFSKKIRQEHDMRGFEPDDILNDPDNREITRQDLSPFYYPSEEEMEEVGVRGIYLSNFFEWNSKKQTERMIKEYDFETAEKKERTFNLYDKNDDAANEVHDYLKYLKFGYGRATDDASYEIRMGRMTREEGVEMVAKYDSVKPSSLKTYLEFMDMTEEEFFQAVEPMRDPKIWEKTGSGEWVVKDSIMNHKLEPGVDEARLPQQKDRTGFIKNSHAESFVRRNSGESGYIVL